MGDKKITKDYELVEAMVALANQLEAVVEITPPIQESCIACC